jgi:hypothetical protein
MIVGEILYPDLSHPRKRITCGCCEINYTNKSYKNLIDNYKLLYLNTYSSEVEYTCAILCHDCFFDNLNKVAKEYELDEQLGLPFYILTKDTELELNFKPSDFVLEESDEEEQQVFMEDFIKEILES